MARRSSLIGRRTGNPFQLKNAASPLIQPRQLVPPRQATWDKIYSVILADLLFSNNCLTIERQNFTNTSCNVLGAFANTEGSFTVAVDAFAGGFYGVGFQDGTELDVQLGSTLHGVMYLSTGAIYYNGFNLDSGVTFTIADLVEPSIDKSHVVRWKKNGVDIGVAIDVSGSLSTVRPALWWAGFGSIGNKATANFSNWAGSVVGTAYNDNLTESAAAAADADPAGSTFGVPLNETAAAGDGFVSTVDFANTLSESAAAQDSLNGGLLVTGSLNETAVAADALSATVTFGPSLAESAAADAQIASQATFASAANESVAALDSAVAGLVIATSVAEAATAGAAVTASQTFANAVAESATADAALTAGVLIGSTLNETAAAAASATTAMTFAAPLNESAAAADSEASAATMPNALGEDAAAAAQVGSAQTFAESINEAATATDNASAGATVYNEPLTETLAAAQSLGVGLVMSGLVSEAAIATDAVAATADLRDDVAEAVAAGDALAAGSDIAAGLGEQLGANDKVDGAVGVSEALDESVVAGDGFDVSQIVGSSTRQRKVLLALKALVLAALPDRVEGFDADFGKVVRIGPLPKEIGRPRGSDEIDFEFGQAPTYTFRQRIDLDLVALGASGGEALDALALAIGVAIAGDRTLGGTVDWAEAFEGRRDSAAKGGVAIANALTVSIIAEYSASSPLAA